MGLHLTGEQLKRHLQIIAQATHDQLCTATRLLGGDSESSESVMQILEMIAGVELLAEFGDPEDVSFALDKFTNNIAAFIEVLHEVKGRANTKRRAPVNDNP